MIRIDKLKDLLYSLEDKEAEHIRNDKKDRSTIVWEDCHNSQFLNIDINMNFCYKNYSAILDNIQNIPHYLESTYI